jgi:hypothetical protein
MGQRGVRLRQMARAQAYQFWRSGGPARAAASIAASEGVVLKHLIGKACRGHTVLISFR